jgi:hypothetical protein
MLTPLSLILFFFRSFHSLKVFSLAASVWPAKGLTLCARNFILFIYFSVVTGTRAKVWLVPARVVQRFISCECACFLFLFRSIEAVVY